MGNNVHNQYVLIMQDSEGVGFRVLLPCEFHMLTPEIGASKVSKVFPQCLCW